MSIVLLLRLVKAVTSATCSTIVAVLTMCHLVLSISVALLLRVLAIVGVVRLPSRTVPAVSHLITITINVLPTVLLALLPLARYAQPACLHAALARQP